jgi:hypothetical protein
MMEEPRPIPKYCYDLLEPGAGTWVQHMYIVFYETWRLFKIHTLYNPHLGISTIKNQNPEDSLLLSTENP